MSDRYQQLQWDCHPTRQHLTLLRREGSGDAYVAAAGVRRVANQVSRTWDSIYNWKNWRISPFKSSILRQENYSPSTPRRMNLRIHWLTSWIGSHSIETRERNLMPISAPHIYQKEMKSITMSNDSSQSKWATKRSRVGAPSGTCTLMVCWRIGWRSWGRIGSSAKKTWFYGDITWEK